MTSIKSFWVHGILFLFRLLLEGFPISLTDDLSKVAPPGWTCQSRCRPFHLDSTGNITGDAHRGQACFWLGKPCYATASFNFQEHSTSCNGDPHLQICVEKSLSSFGAYFKTGPYTFVRTRPGPVSFLIFASQLCCRNSFIS